MDDSAPDLFCSPLLKDPMTDNKFSTITVHLHFRSGVWHSEANAGKGWRIVGRRMTSKGIESATRTWIARHTGENGSVALLSWFDTPTHALQGGVVHTNV